MSLFDRLADEALRNLPGHAPLRAVVEKELLHHDILREMNAAGLLSSLTFIGGTCLRACYGSARLSEDLDFTGGGDFTRNTLADLAGTLVRTLEAKYALAVRVTEPVKVSAGVDTWKLAVLTHPGRRDLPPQRIHVDVCAIPSRDRRPMMLRNPYGVDMGTSGLILYAQSRGEILADKFIALAFRPNRLKNRDLWDIAWLKQQGVELPADLIPLKIADRRQTPEIFAAALQTRLAALKTDPACRAAFVAEMQRFLPSRLADESVAQEPYWTFLVNLLDEEIHRIFAALKA
ncbi:MAG: nucleotidyl transferase AbiEii/AbiGii toxin family protein [Kiritimatiellia bacterium]